MHIRLKVNILCDCLSQEQCPSFLWGLLPWELQDMTQQLFFNVKGQQVNILDFASHTVSVAAVPV